MQDILTGLENAPAWPIVAIGLVLIIVDVLLTNDSYLAWIGVSVFGVALLNAYGMPGMVQLIGFPIILFVTLVHVRAFFISTSEPRDLSVTPERLRGCMGTVIDIKEDDPALGRIAVVDHGEWRCRTQTGERLSTQGRVRVIGNEGLTLLVDLDPGDQAS